MRALEILAGVFLFAALGLMILAIATCPLNDAELGKYSGKDGKTCVEPDIAIPEGCEVREHKQPPIVIATKKSMQTGLCSAYTIVVFQCEDKLKTKKYQWEWKEP